MQNKPTESSIPAPDSEVGQLRNRLVALEEQFMHEQRTVEQLNQVVTEQQTRLERLEAALTRMTLRIDAVRAAVETGPRSPEEERPPHY